MTAHACSSLIAAHIGHCIYIISEILTDIGRRLFLEVNYPSTGQVLTCLSIHWELSSLHSSTNNKLGIRIKIVCLFV
jgi:hypothetical protein